MSFSSLEKEVQKTEDIYLSFFFLFKKIWCAMSNSVSVVLHSMENALSSEVPPIQ